MFCWQTLFIFQERQNVMNSWKVAKIWTFGGRSSSLDQYELLSCQNWRVELRVCSSIIEDSTLVWVLKPRTELCPGWMCDGKRLVSVGVLTSKGAGPLVLPWIDLLGSDLIPELPTNQKGEENIGEGEQQSQGALG